MKFKKATLLSLHGKTEYAACVKLASDVSIEHSCFLTWHNELFLFGGLHENETRQIVQLVGKSLRRVGLLNFDHQRATCSNMKNRDKIFLCFDVEDDIGCRVSTNPMGSFNRTRSSNFTHRIISTATSDCELTFIL